MRALTQKQHSFVIAYADGHPLAVAEKMAGISPRTSRRLRASPYFRQIIRERARSIIADAAPRAARRLDELMMQDDSKAVAKDSAIALLAIEGLKAPSAPTPPPINIGVGVYTGPYILNNDEERAAYRAHVRKWGVPQGAGYIINWKSDTEPDVKEPDAIEHVPNET